ncbi:DNA-directed RNA polymerase I subunit RPA43 isoform X1 [Silurus asotus]|uniref:DNA-directed RNA polymerase subunit n=1 Tax=Silurus asotus TaxID=30991 RepID=A0AAD5FMH1_SILAS|nr:DNA-directed RNA polymerase I subunit RPA43 isoform X1 [Silurus asotus]
MANLEQSEAEQNRSVTGQDKSSLVLNPAAGRDALSVPCLIPSFAEARELVPTPYSCLVLQTHRRHVVLPPMYLQKKRTGIQQELNAELLKFSESLKGVPLAYEDIKIIGRHGDIFDDQGYIHLNIEASFVVFKPKKRQTLVKELQRAQPLEHVPPKNYTCITIVPRTIHTISPTLPCGLLPEDDQLKGQHFDTIAEIRHKRQKVSDTLRTENFQDPFQKWQERWRISFSYPSAGVINKIGVGHAGCLVHGCFNASVVKPTQLTSEQWRDSGLKLGESLTFEVFQLDADVAGVLLIRGRLEKSRLNELLSSFDTTETGQDETMEMTPGVDLTEDQSEMSEALKPRKKKKKKDKEKDNQALEEVETDEAGGCEVNGNGTEVDSDPSSCLKEKKKKKRKKEKKESDTELPSLRVDLPGSDSSGYLSDKSSKKRKAQEDGVQEDANGIAAKKKKKIK